MKGRSQSESAENLDVKDKLDLPNDLGLTPRRADGRPSFERTPGGQCSLA